MCKVKTVTFYNNIDTEQILGSCSNISVGFFFRVLNQVHKMRMKTLKRKYYSFEFLLLKIYLPCPPQCICVFGFNPST